MQVGESAHRDVGSIGSLAETTYEMFTVPHPSWPVGPLVLHCLFVHTRMTFHHPVGVSVRKLSKGMYKPLVTCKLGR
jgi:hypothetical protein